MVLPRAEPTNFGCAVQAKLMPRIGCAAAWYKVIAAKLHPSHTPLDITMASAYVSPPRSPIVANAPPSPDAVFAVLSQPPPPTLREVLAAYSTKGEGDREMLIALLKAKAAEDDRIANVAKLQQQVIQMQLTALSAHIQSTLTKRPEPVESHERRSPVSPSPPARRARTPIRARAHPYSRPPTDDHPLWRGRKSWDVSVSDERSTSEDGADY
ncbi:unnamed protein product [Rhizoctonia solani]|uniref:Uncharacterized protein n=1 Tax=Rhizoctonia solani TaxID=456999 RepID=A0A8H3E2T8_9AGAM|nr:unnamed protein product [Rhizoctonia solani]